MAAPKGNRYAAHDKPWTRALEKHAAQNPDKLARLAERVFSAALDGDMAATKELADRLDGKPAQHTTVSTPDGEAIRVEVEAQANEVRAKLAAAIAAQSARAGSSDAE